MTRLRALLVPLAGTLAAAPAAPQAAVLELVGTQPGTGFTMVAAFAGDVDGDGVGDVIVGAQTDDTAGQNAGTARVHSGADGSVLHALFGSTGAYFGAAVDGLGDLTGDGRAEFIVGAPRAPFGGFGQAGAAYVFDGATGAQLFAVGGATSFDRAGGAVSGAGDVDADGVPDFVVGANGADQSPNDDRGSVRAFSGADGAELFEVFGTNVDGFGHCVNAAGDVDGDGFDDVIASALDVSLPNASGHVKVLSGADGSVLYTFSPALPFYWFGVSCDGAGDVDGDGRPDVIFGIQHDPTVGYQAGAAELRSGATGALIRTLYADTIVDLFGQSVAGAGDVDGDGLDDVVVGASGDHWGLGGQGSATVFAGADGSVIFRVYGDDFGDALGQVVAGGGDLDGDGAPEVIVVAPEDDDGGSNAGKLRVLTRATPDCLDVTPYCAGLPNSAGAGATMHFTGTTSASGNDLALHVSGGPSGQPGLFYFGPDQVSLPFGNGLRCVGGTTNRLGVSTVDFFGHAVFVVDNTAPQTGGLLVAGSTHNVQFWYRDLGVGAGFNLSDALAVTFCP